MSKRREKWWLGLISGIIMGFVLVLGTDAPTWAGMMTSLIVFTIIYYSGDQS